MTGSVFVGTPFYESVSGFFCQAMVGYAGRGLVAGTITQHGGDVAQNREDITARFLESDGEWLWWVDSDQIPGPDVLRRLLDGAEGGRLVVGALVQIPAPGRPRPNVWTCDMQGPAQYVELPAGPRWRNALTGTGCLLTHRSVYETVAAPWWRRLDAVGVGTIGEDLSFAMRCEMAGVKVWVDTETRCAHRKAVTFQ